MAYLPVRRSLLFLMCCDALGALPRSHSGRLAATATPYSRFPRSSILTSRRSYCGSPTLPGTGGLSLLPPSLHSPCLCLFVVRAWRRWKRLPVGSLLSEGPIMYAYDIRNDPMMRAVVPLDRADLTKGIREKVHPLLRLRFNWKPLAHFFTSSSDGWRAERAAFMILRTRIVIARFSTAFKTSPNARSSASMRSAASVQIGCVPYKNRNLSCTLRLSVGWEVIWVRPG